MKDEPVTVRPPATRRAGLRVVHVSFHNDVEGRSPSQLLAAWPTLTRVARAAAQAGVRVEVVQACRQDATLRADGVDVHFVRETTGLGPLSHPLLSKLSSARCLLERVASFEPDVVHVSGLSFPLQLRNLRERLPGTPILVQDHAGAPPRGWRRALHRWGLAVVDGAAFTAREQAAPFFQAGLFRGDVPVFEVLEDSSRFAPGDQAEARRLSGLYGDPCLLWLGRLDPFKDPITVLDALALAADEAPDARLWCCYRDAPLEGEVRARVASDLRLHDRVFLLGPRSHAEVETLCRAADFLVQGSLREGSGYAVIEALACGTTPIVTDVPALRKITGEGRFGALSPAGDSAAMARNLVEWARKDRALLRREAREHFEHRLSYEAIGRDLRAAYEALLGTK